MRALTRAVQLFQRDSFPSLAPIAPTHWGQPTTSTATAATTGARSVKKSPTSSGGRLGNPSTVWARVERAATSPLVPGLPPPQRHSDRFPALPPASSNPNVASAARASSSLSSTPWATRGATSAPHSHQDRTVFPTFVDTSPPFASPTTGMRRTGSSSDSAERVPLSAPPEGEFPGLPTSDAVAKRTAQKKAIFGVRTQSPAAVALAGSVWGVAPPVATNGAARPDLDVNSLSLDERGSSEGQGQGKGKGRKKKQVLLYRA
jgi:hypothetical protein